MTRKKRTRTTACFSLSVLEELEKDGILQSCPFSQNERVCSNTCPFFEIWKDGAKKYVRMNCNKSIDGTYTVKIGEKRADEVDTKSGLQFEN